MILNTDKTIFMNVLINYRYHYDEAIVLDENVSILP